MRRFILNAIARLLGGRDDKPVPLTPEYALLPEILVVENDRAGARLLKQLRDYPQPHLSVYWPRCGESSIAGIPAARVTILSGGDRLSREEREMLRSRTLPWGERALWLED